MCKKTIIHFDSGANLDDAIELAVTLGCEVKSVRRTGEIKVKHPDLPKSVRVNGRRKDCPRQLSCYLKRLLSTRCGPREAI
jgi:hypothetical protein